MQSPPALTAYQKEMLPLILEVILARSNWWWIKPSWIMATIRIESGWNPMVVNQALRRDGLMQVEPSTAAQMNAEYSLDLQHPQTDPYTSILTGVAYYDASLRYLLRTWGVKSIPLSAVIEAYNEGYGAAAKGKMVPPYWIKWAAAQQGYNFVDGLGTMVSA